MTLRSVDRDVHRFPPTMGFAGCRQISTDSYGCNCGRLHLCDPVARLTFVGICRVDHNRIEPGMDGKTPEIGIGMARPRAYGRDLL